MKNSANGTSFLLGTVLGGAIGATVALFCAPKSGKQLRKDLSKKCEAIRENFSELGEETADWIKEKTAVVKDATEDASENAKHLAQKGKDAIEAAKDKLKK
jgi:gas vesicle protein